MGSGAIQEHRYVLRTRHAQVGTGLWMEAALRIVKATHGAFRVIAKRVGGARLAAAAGVSHRIGAPKRDTVGGLGTGAKPHLVAGRHVL